MVDYFKKFGHMLAVLFDDTHHFITKLLSTADADKVSIAAVIMSYDTEKFFNKTMRPIISQVTDIA